MMKKLDPKKTVYIIDGSSFLYRAYYAMRPLHTSQGEAVQAVYGFIRMLKKMLTMFNPEYMVLVWDSPGKNSRHTLFTDYKATRQAPPSDLFEQKKYINEFAHLIGLKEIAIPGIEADDLMYSLAQDLKKEGLDIVLITSDKDMGQMLDEHTYIYDSFKDVLHDQASFEQKMSVPIHKLPFYFALLGDTSDNIPGVHGIGEKGALELVHKYDSLEDMYDHVDDITKSRVYNALKQGKDNAFLSRTLFLLQYHPLSVPRHELAFCMSNWQKAKPLFQTLNFKSLLKDIDEQAGERQSSLLEQVVDSPKKKLINYDFKSITTAEELAQLIKLLQEEGVCALDTETTGINPLHDPIVGLSFAVDVGRAWYIPFGHKSSEQQLGREQVIVALKPVLEDPSIKKYMHNAPFDTTVLWHAGIRMQGIAFDSLLAAKLINKEWQKASLKALSEYYLGEAMLSYQEVVKDNKYPDFSHVPLDLAARYAAADAHQTFRLCTLFQTLLDQEQLKELFESIEHPVQQILLGMQERGIYVDKEHLALLGKQVHKDLVEIEDRIISLAGPSYAGINLNSPKQVERLLFYDLQLTPQKKSATGSYSTDHQVLQALSKQHPIPGLIAKYRELAKLKSTYIDVLPQYINPKTNKIHTSFSQTSVATGRLASTDPNLQNIPTDAGYGIEVRAAFKPDEGAVFVSADYSQIELRVMAYLSQDPALLHAFMQGADIHTETAAKLFRVLPQEVTHEQRQIGKRINFSVLYGLTPYGLSKDLDIPFKDAKQYIDTYFEQYQGVRSWMDKVIEETKQKGYVTTLYGRRRYIPAIYESNRSLYQEAVRVAINTCVQGTAADIMKLGMIALVKAIEEQQIPMSILLQIHDELLLSVQKDQEQLACETARKALEQVVQWNIPLYVTTRSGHTWKDVTK